MNRKYYMVRAMDSQPKEFEVFFKNNVIAVGWSKVDFTQYERTEVKELRKKVDEEYFSSGKWHPPVIGKKLNEVIRFHHINNGDFIIIPYYNSIRLAIAQEEHIYNVDSYDLDLANQVKAFYLMKDNEYKTIPRNSLSEGLQRRLRVRGSTVSDLYEFKEEIEKIFDKDNYSWTSDHEEKVTEFIESIKDQLFSNIQNGLTNLITGGIGLEHLVKELFDCEGYSANVLAKNSFEGYGDADIYAVKSDKFQETKVLIQVKHHSGYTDNWGIEQLKQIQDDITYQDYKFVLVTSALIGREVKNSAISHDVSTIDGRELIDWIFEHFDKLKDETKTRLGLSNVPHFIE